MARWLAEWSAALAFSAAFFGVIFGMVSCIENAPAKPACVLVASIETDTYAPYGMVAHRRKYRLNQYQCGDKTKTVVE